MLEQLRHRLRALQKTAGIVDGARALPLGIAASTRRSAAAWRAARCMRSRRRARPISPRRRALRSGWQRADATRVFWIAEDMALAESGAPYGAGLDAFGLRPERLLTVSAAQRCDLLVGDGGSAALPRRRRRDRRTAPRRDRPVALRRLSLAAAESGALAVAAARAAGARRLHRGDALDRRRGAQCAASPSSSCATAAARSARGFSNGVTAMNVSSSRLLSLWLRRLSTDRIVRSREVSSPLADLRQARQCRVDRRRRRSGGAARPHAGLALAQARAMHPALQAIEEDAEADAGALGKHRRLVPALHAAGGLRSARRPAARHQRLRASLRRRRRARRRSRPARRASRLYLPHRRRRHASARPGPPRISASPQATLAARNALCFRRCRSPRCGCRRRPSRRWRASA